MEKVSINTIGYSHKLLGKAPAKSSPKMLSLSNYIKKAEAVPQEFDFWKKRVPFEPYDVGNLDYGNCTIASQVLLGQRAERLEQRRTLTIPKQEIVKTYLNLTSRLYGGGDTGAYEIDALSNWRRADTTFKDDKGRPYTIDAYVKVAHWDNEELKKALYMAGPKGIKVCFNLPLAWAYAGQHWDIPESMQPVGDYLPGSWGGHSMMATARWNKEGLWLPSTWVEPDIFITWRAMSIYCDEAYMVIDSVNAWKKKPVAKLINLNELRADVNAVSSTKIA